MKILKIPVLPLRDIVVFPHMVAPLFVGRKLSINALNHVMTNDKLILLITQKNYNIENPSPKDLYTFGTIGKILQLLKLPDNTIKVLVEGIERVKVNEIIQEKDFIIATTSSLKIENKHPAKIKALTKMILDQFDSYQKINKKYLLNC